MVGLFRMSTLKTTFVHSWIVQNEYTEDYLSTQIVQNEYTEDYLCTLLDCSE